MNKLPLKYINYIHYPNDKTELQIPNEGLCRKLVATELTSEEGPLLLRQILFYRFR